MNEFKQLREAKRLNMISRKRIESYCSLSGDRFGSTWEKLKGQINMPRNSHPLDKEKELTIVIDKFLK